MAVYQPVHVKIWSDEWFDALRAPSKLLFLYFLTSPANTPSGIFTCSLKRMSFDTGLTPRACKTSLADLEGHVEYDEAKALVWIVNAKRYWPNSPNVLRAVSNELEALNGHYFAAQFRSRYPEVVTGIANLKQGASKGSGNPLPTSEGSEGSEESEESEGGRDMGDTRARARGPRKVHNDEEVSHDNDDDDDAANSGRATTTVDTGGVASRFQRLDQRGARVHGR